MPLDVRAEATIGRPAGTVAAHMFDPANDPDWIGGIRTARLLGEPPVRVGSRTAREARFAGRTIRYVMEVVALEPGRRLEMRSVKAPFPMHVVYAVEDAGPGRSVASVRVRGGEGSRFLRLLGPFVPPMVRRNIQADVHRLRDALETSG